MKRTSQKACSISGQNLSHVDSRDRDNALLALAASDSPRWREIETLALSRLPANLNRDGALYALLYRAAVIEAAASLYPLAVDRNAS